MKPGGASAPGARLLSEAYCLSLVSGEEAAGVQGWGTLSSIGPQIRGSTF